MKKYIVKIVHGSVVYESSIMADGFRVIPEGVVFSRLIDEGTNTKAIAFMAMAGLSSVQEVDDGAE